MKRNRTSDDDSGDAGGESAATAETRTERPRRGPGSRRRSAAAWGAVGALTVLVAHQGYVLLGGESLGLPVALAVAAAVFAVVAPLSYLAEGALIGRNGRA